MSTVGLVKPQDQQAEKKRYESPKLLVYGDIRVITQTGGSSGKTDSGFGTKT